ncbi:3'-5' exonuclease [Tepidibacillus marianensis]|uniref:3'-5' exonuclease n=1 Tax=Tepidibacillus marianensis TaxID=3131995 RepID=UPI0030D26AC3
MKEKKREFIAETEDKYDRLLQQARWKSKEEEKRHQKALEIIEKREEVLAFIERKSKMLVKEYMAQFLKKDLFTYYKELVTNKEYMRELESSLSDEQIEFLTENMTILLKKKRYEIEDTGALLYLHHQLFGFKEPIKIRNVVIDEAQDFSLFQLFVLKKIVNTDLFSVLGDLSQGIHSYRGIQNWDRVMESIFPNAAFRTLEQSYRTTVEIMNVANEIIRQSQVPDLLLAKPVVRHGEKPFFISYEEVFAVSLAENIQQMKEKGYKSVAIIGKTMEECRRIEDQIKKLVEIPVRVLLGEEEYQTDEIVIVPAHIAKGLEFDVVFVVTVDEMYGLDDLEVKLLYVAMTRPLHRLFVYYQGKQYPLLEKVNPEVYQLEGGDRK